MNTSLTIFKVAQNPHLLETRFRLVGWGDIVFRPLLASDENELGEFLAALSAETRHFWHLDSYDQAAAQELCAAIGRYDKLRLAAITPQGATRLLTLFEFSFGIPPGDLERYSGYGMPLDERTDCRFGPCVRAELQGSGLAHLLMPSTCEIARRFGKQRMILWGGVLAKNQRALRFYTREGFREVGRFTHLNGMACIDMLLELRDRPARVVG